MCHQHFVHYSCGHSALRDQHECELQPQIPFPILPQCKHYSMSRETVSPLCGHGRIYCAKTPEGIFFDKLYLLLDTTNQEFERLDHDTNAILAARLARHNTASKDHLSPPQLPSTPHAPSDSSPLSSLSKQRDQTTSLRWEALTLIAEGIAYIARRGEHETNHQHLPFPPFGVIKERKMTLPLVIRDLLTSMELAQVGTSPGALRSSIIEKVHDPGPHAGEEVSVAPAPKTPPNKNEPLPPRSSGPSNFTPAAASTPSPLETTHQLASPIALAPKREVLDEEVYIPPEPPRRSGRVTKRDINYAESDASDFEFEDEPNVKDEPESPIKLDLRPAKKPRRKRPSRPRRATGAETPPPLVAGRGSVSSAIQSTRDVKKPLRPLRPRTALVPSQRGLDWSYRIPQSSNARGQRVVNPFTYYTNPGSSNTAAGFGNPGFASFYGNQPFTHHQNALASTIQTNQARRAVHLPVNYSLHTSMLPFSNNFAVQQVPAGSYLPGSLSNMPFQGQPMIHNNLFYTNTQPSSNNFYNINWRIPRYVPTPTQFVAPSQTPQRQTHTSTNWLLNTPAFPPSSNATANQTPLWLGGNQQIGTYYNTPSHHNGASAGHQYGGIQDHGVGQGTYAADMLDGWWMGNGEELWSGGGFMR